MMVVKPVALVVGASLVVLGSAAGTYFAVRENRAAVTPQPADTVPALPGPSPIESTEEVIEPANPPTEAPGPITVAKKADKNDSSSRRAVPSSEARPAPVTKPPAAAPDPPAANPATVDSAPSEPPSAPDLPPVEGWSPLPERWPSNRADAGDDAEPRRIALDTIDAGGLGTELAPEEQPSIRRELVIAADSVIGLQVDTPVTSEDAVVEDDVEARVTRDVTVGDEIAIPAGTRVLGSVVLVEQAGQLRGSSRLGVRFHTVVLDEIVEVPITTETVYREGKGRGGESAAKIGGAAVGGAILGAIFGGRQGAAIGGAAGAAGGTAAAMAGDGQPATLPAGLTLTIRLSRPSTVTVKN